MTAAHFEPSWCNISPAGPGGPESYNEDVPKTKDLELRLQRTEDQLRLFQKVSRFMVRDLNLQEVLRGVVQLVVEFTRCDSCLVYLLDKDELVLCASNTPHPSTIGKIRLKTTEGLTGWVARERRLDRKSVV
jgi:transcriptional regulator with GAF, ATPase, and Fis domain